MGSMASLNKKQLKHAKTVVRVIKGIDLPLDQQERACDIAFETIKVESDFQNYANINNPESLRLPHDNVGDDHGSVNMFQQQVGGAVNSTANWGTTKQLMNIPFSVRKFVSVLTTKNNGEWLKLSNGAAAQMVQGSEYPTRYQLEDAWAIELRRELWPITHRRIRDHPIVKKFRHKKYTVNSGDTLYSIATKFNTTVNAIVNLNHIENPNKIVPGQVLRIPK